jgi:transcription termination factor Rho
MSIMDRSALKASPLADLHAIASELSIDGYRRLRKEQLIDAILSRQGGSDEVAGAETEEPPPETEEPPPETEEPPAEAEEVPPPAEEVPPPAEEVPPPAEEVSPPAEEAPPTEAVEGVIELLPNGSAFVRVHPPEPSDEDVYVSAAQVKRCELVSGDRVSGPRRSPRRSERFASLGRIDTINGQPAAEVAAGERFDDLEAAFPDERLLAASEDPTVQAIESLAPLGRGSRATIVGPAATGKTESLRRLAVALAADQALQLLLVLVGVRPEEISEWGGGPVAPVAALSIGASPDAQGQAVERVIDEARRLAARGGNVVVLVDTLDRLPPHAARRALAGARKLVRGGSLTVVATASAPLGGETTVIALDPAFAAAGRFPALDVSATWSLRPERLVGEEAAEQIARTRSEALPR